MTSRAGLALACLAFGWTAASPSAKPEQRFGVLLFGEDANQDWAQVAAAAARKLPPHCPLEFVSDPADAKGAQRAVDRLQARTKKIVAVGLWLSSRSDAMDETRFLLGIREKPSPGYFRSHGLRQGNSIVRRVQSRVPIVLAPALDDDPLVADILTARALSLSKRSGDEAVVLIGFPPDSPDQAEPYLANLALLAEQIRARGGFKAARAAALGGLAGSPERRRGEESLRRLVRELSRQQRVLVVLHAVDSSTHSPGVLRALQGVFMRYNGKGLLPDDRLARWIAQSARQGAEKQDMRSYRDAGRPLAEVKAGGSREKTLENRR